MPFVMVSDRSIDETVPVAARLPAASNEIRLIADAQLRDFILGHHDAILYAPALTTSMAGEPASKSSPALRFTLATTPSNGAVSIVSASWLG